MSGWGKAALYFHTVRHLKPVQVWGRLGFRLRRPRPDCRPAPAARARPATWVLPPGRAPSMLGPDRFRFLNEEGSLPSAGGWELPERSHLWLYNLHYFDDLNAVGTAERRQWHASLLSRWISENAPGRGVGWEPYPTSLRIVNWVKWSWAGGELGADGRDSLAVQARWLARRLEKHLLGNHLLANAKALVFAGCYFEGPEADAWLKLGMPILVRELAEQVLPDGGHFERSTMYHALAFEDMLDLLNLVRCRAAQLARWERATSGWRDTARRMGRWLAVMSHPDGEIAFFNDAAFGIAAAPSALAEYASQLGVSWEPECGDGAVWLEHSGYVRARIGDAVLFADLAPVGPDHLPAHAHADTLSFELSLGGQRIAVNSGTSRYGIGEERQRQRSTAAHNTVEVEGTDSSEVWAGFRVGRRARPFGMAVRAAADAVRIEGAHDGYRRLAGIVVHRRSWMLRAGMLEVVDRLEGSAAEAIAHIHMHPAITVERRGGEGLLRWDGGAASWLAERCVADIVDTTWHPEFGAGLRISALALRFGGRNAECRFVLKWSRTE